jgi:uncharacterized glyoxalase superfamily protein PhnB
MTTENRWQAPDIVPNLAYENVPKAAEWLCRAFDFKERSNARFTWDGGAMTWLEIGDCLVRLSTSGGHDLFAPKVVGGLSAALKVYVDDVDQHFTHAKSAGANIVSVLEDGFWGGRSYRADDLEGHRWEFSQKGRDLPADAWRLPPGLRRGS